MWKTNRVADSNDFINDVVIEKMKRMINHMCRDCGKPATCHIYKEKEIIHLCIEHYRAKEQK